MTRPLRVLQVLGGLGMGGAETWLMAVLRRWVRNGTGKMDFLLTGGQKELFDVEAAALGARLHYLRYGRTNLMDFAKQFRRLLRAGHYDAIHDHADYAGGWRLAMGSGVLPPVRVVHIHNPWLHIKANYAISPSRRIAAAGGKVLVHGLATHVCGTSAESLQQYGFQPGRLTGPNVSVLHCGFDIDQFNSPRAPDRERVLAEFGWSPDAKIVLFAGRLDRALEFVHPQNHKNSWLALNAVREAVLRDSAVRFIMAGEGPSRSAMIEAVQKWGLAERLRLPGIRQDIPVLMRASDVLLFPSAQEGLGMVAVEAQAAGLPVLASTFVPKEAVVIPSLYRTLAVDAGLHVWAEELITVMNRPRLDLGFCRAAMENSEFSIEESAKKLEGIYRSKRQHEVAYQ